MTDDLLGVLRAVSQQQGVILTRIDGLDHGWREERSAISRRLDSLELAERTHRERVIEWTPHVDRIRGATDATLNRLGQAALITVIVVAALVGGGALLPRLLTMSAPPSHVVGGP